MNSEVTREKSNNQQNPNEELLNILNQLATHRGLLDRLDNINYIISLLNAGADLNLQNQDGKTLLHYVAECNDINGISFLLNAGAKLDLRDQSEKTPLQYVTDDHCLQAIKLLLEADALQNQCSQAIEKTSSSENEENSTNGSNDVPEQHVSDKKHIDQNDSESGYGSSNETESNDLRKDEQKDPEVNNCLDSDESSEEGSDDYLFLKDSLLMKLEIPLTTNEQKLTDDFYEEIGGITAQNGQESILESIEKIVNDYLEKGVRLNSYCSRCKKTVANLILEEITNLTSGSNVSIRSNTVMRSKHSNPPYRSKDQNCDEENEISEDGVIRSVIYDVLSKGGKVKRPDFFDGNEFEQIVTCNKFCDNLSEKCKESENKLKNIAHKSIVNKNEQIKKDGLGVEIDNGYFCIEYPQDSIIEPAKILNNEKVEGLRVGILKIGESIVRVEKNKNGKRNYTDILKGSIEMSFTTEVGEVSIHLSPNEEDSNKVKVEIDKENEARLNELKAKGKNLGKNCFLGGKSVLKAIEDRGFEKHGSVPTTELNEIFVASERSSDRRW